MRRTNFDLVVVGGGPAGASAAITAARIGASVGLFEAGDFPRQKVCGEFVSAESLSLLRELLREHPRAEELFRDAPAISRARLFVGGRTLETNVDPPALSIPRYQFDLSLWEAAQRAGASAHSSCEILSFAGRGPFAVQTSNGEVTARALILCAGRWSRFSNHVELPPGPKWIGLKAHFADQRPSPSTDLYFFDGGYCGVQPVSRDAVNVCAMVRSDVAASLDEVIQLSSPLARRAERWQPLMRPVTTAPLLYRRPEPVRENVMLAGDAAGFIDPFAGDGISLALRTGHAAASCLQPFFAATAPLESAVARYASLYERDFAPLITAASRIRSLLGLPQAIQVLAVHVLGLPGVLPYVIRKTRSG
jgi:flavin-dependent dehydrogenase